MTKVERIIPERGRAPWWAALACWARGHRQGVRVNEPPYGRIVTACPRCGNRRVGRPKPEAAAT